MVVVLGPPGHLTLIRPYRKRVGFGGGGCCCRAPARDFWRFYPRPVRMARPPACMPARPRQRPRVPGPTSPQYVPTARRRFMLRRRAVLSTCARTERTEPNRTTNQERRANSRPYSRPFKLFAPCLFLLFAFCSVVFTACAVYGFTSLKNIFTFLLNVLIFVLILQKLCKCNGARFHNLI